jgi:CopG family transcriptional regulator / antitoxin EndoAI
MYAVEGWRCLFVSQSNAKEVLIQLPHHLVKEMDGFVEQDKISRDELVHKAMKMYFRDRKNRQITEMMRQGYMEMAKINLNIASEAFLAEEEADSTLGRLVSGV